MQSWGTHLSCLSEVKPAHVSYLLALNFFLQEKEIVSNVGGIFTIVLFPFKNT